MPWLLAMAVHSCERDTLLEERIQHTNRIKGLLSGHCITDYDPLGKNRHNRLDVLKTGDGCALPERLKMEIRREIERLDLVNAQIATVERERDALVKPTVDADAQNCRS
jgi:transposase